LFDKSVGGTTYATFNEATRVQMPGMVHLTRLGYRYFGRMHEDIPVIISSRIDDGVITKDNLLCKNTVAANTLPPQKAAILLRLALTGETSQEQLEALFEQY
jgi:L-asparaginase/Glu-tRNA(Gln) amidotransferase subunit D